MKGGILAFTPEAIVYYSSGRLVCRGRGFKRGSPSRKNFFSSRSVRTRRRLSFTSALRLFFFFSSNADKTPICACNSHIWRVDIWRHSLSASSLALSLLCHEVLIHAASAGGGGSSEARVFPRHMLLLKKEAATVCKLCCRGAQRLGLRN